MLIGVINADYMKFTNGIGEEYKIYLLGWELDGSQRKEVPQIFTIVEHQ